MKPLCTKHCLPMLVVCISCLMSTVNVASAQIKASQRVTLIADSSTPICPRTSVPHTFSDRLLPDGTRQPFTIPNGEVLVITSFDWVVEGSTQADNNVWTAVALIGTTTSNLAILSGGTADSIGRASGHTDVPDGVVVKAGTALCLDFVAGAQSAFALVHGYLDVKQ